MKLHLSVVAAQQRLHVSDETVCCSKNRSGKPEIFTVLGCILVISYGRFGTTHPSHLQGCSSMRRNLVTDVLGQPIGPIVNGQAVQGER